ncbi:transcriptional regulator [Vibrio sp.]|uniref:Transcriptional regulator n=1 Tax=Vibrio viridaestus TaxID=2487322 RepID=A0A3N9TB44_9VIBR|nr:metalloregulator ArsR/SmtB family transcription factor [Vibrio viridaestus]MDC0610093.1 transcriptional regulator [Vibrio sp.]RQW61311.1 transcriptional regulator [Vibrio viridaestus]
MKTADKILHIIKKEGTVTAKQLAEQFSITTMGARQHLQSLEDDGLLKFYDVKVKVGRPTRHWTLTAQGHEHFVDRHSELTVQMIDAVETVFGSDGLKKIAEEREVQTLHAYQKALEGSSSLVDKLNILVELREKEGYMVELEAVDNGFLLIENHCPICRAATRCPALCQSELHIFQTLLKGQCTVERKDHIVSGQRRCTYQIRPTLTSQK